MKEVNLKDTIRDFETWINTPVANKKRIVVFTGAGVSADSGIATFRDADGLWANYRIEEVCTPEALSINRNKVIEFYNMRRKESLTKKPNDGHLAIAQLEQWADVCVITQNVDNLHEQAGSTRVLHLHGELMKLRSEKNPTLIYEIQEWEQSLDARAKDGALLRPHIVFFGEDVPMFQLASKIVEQADILIIVGTSLAIYPAASLVYYMRDENVPIYLVDPGTPDISIISNPLTHIKQRGAVGVPVLVEQLRKELDIGVELKDVIQGLRSLRNRSVQIVLEDFEGKRNAGVHF